MRAPHTLTWALRRGRLVGCGVESAKPTAGSLAPAGRDVPSEAILLINGGDAETQRSHVLKWA
jgi:hypothetical protein